MDVAENYVSLCVQASECACVICDFMNCDEMSDLEETIPCTGADKHRYPPCTRARHCDLAAIAHGRSIMSRLGT